MNKTQSVRTRTYRYKGYNAQGQHVSGELCCPSLQLAKIQLRRQGIHLKKIQTIARLPHRRILNISSIKSTEIHLFTRQLATLLKANIALSQALELICSGLQHQRMQQLLQKLKNQVEGGQRFSQALTQQKQYFDTLYVALIQIGEQSGSLDIMLDRIACYQEKTERLKQKIKKALWYPLLISCVALCVSFILILKVVPIFRELFTSFSAELPLFTQWILNLSSWLQTYCLYLLSLIMVILSITRYGYQHSPKLRLLLERHWLKLPIFGDLLSKSIIARYYRTLATTFAAGVPLLEALEYTAAVSNNTLYQNAVIKIRDDVARGQQLHVAMRSSQLFPHMAVQMVQIGEESGALTEMLDNIAERFETEVAHTVEGLSTLLEPCLLIFLSLIVGSLVVAMYLPIFKMGSII